MRELREMLHAAAGRPRNELDVGSIRHAVRRRKQRRVAVALCAVVLIAGATSATAAQLRRDDRSVAAADQTSFAVLYCTIELGDESANALFNTRDGHGSAEIGAYTVTFELVEADRGRALRADVHGPPMFEGDPHPDLPPGVILRAEGGYPHHRSSDAIAEGFFKFSAGGGGVGLSGSCSEMQLPAIEPERVAIGPNAGEFGYLDENASLLPVFRASPNADGTFDEDGPFEVYDPDDGSVIGWWFNAVGLRAVGEYPTDAERATTGTADTVAPG